MDIFKDHPKSIGEIKAEKKGDASLWTARDILIDMLRRIDNGLQVKTCIFCYTYLDDKKDERISFSQSTENALETIGLMNAVAIRIVIK